MGTNRLENTLQSVKINIHDGLAMRILEVNSGMSFLDVQDLVAETMKRSSPSVEIGYEAPWSAKVGTKKTLAYITSEAELSDFWLAYKRYVGSSKPGKRSKTTTENMEIIFRNLRDSTAVRLLHLLIFCSAHNYNTF